ncbi:MAG TPA: DsbA family protein, partial [Haliangiales bacterium]|nr:DsbA family protein [Haliangiales bacterium]
GPSLVIEHRAFPLRPTPVPPVPFKGTYREAGWQRCNAMSAADGISFTPWPHATMPNWSLPALEAAKCAARQGDELFERLHSRLYEAYFTQSLNIGEPRVVADVVADAGLDMARFNADLDAGVGREAVLKDYEAAVAEGVRAIPTVIVPQTGRVLVGLADASTYRAAVEEAAG